MFISVEGHVDEVSKWTASRPIVLLEVGSVSVVDEPSLPVSHMLLTLQRLAQVGDLLLEALAF